MNFTLLPAAIADTLERGGNGLNEDQRMLLMGSLAFWQSQIEMKGLCAVIEGLEDARGRAELPQIVPKSKDPRKQTSP